MCLIVDAAMTREVQAKDKPLTLYKVFGFSRFLQPGKLSLCSPFKNFQATAGLHKVDKPYIGPSKKYPYTLDEACQRLIDVTGFHCFVYKDDAVKFAHFRSAHLQIYQVEDISSVSPVCEVKSHTKKVFVAGVTPAGEIISDEFKADQYGVWQDHWPTYVVSEMTIEEAEYDRIMKIGEALVTHF